MNNIILPNINTKNKNVKEEKNKVSFLCGSYPISDNELTIENNLPTKEISRIDYNLYISSFEQAIKFINTSGIENIKVIIKISNYFSKEYIQQDLKIYYIFLDDKTDEEVTFICNIPKVISLIEYYSEKNINVMLCCDAGISRSASFAIAYIMMKKYKNFDEAYEYVKEQRNCINPNMGFILVLKDLENKYVMENLVKNVYNLKKYYLLN